MQDKKEETIATTPIVLKKEKLAAILREYNPKLWQRSNRTMSNLNSLLSLPQDSFTESDISSKIEDDYHFFQKPPVVRNNLTNAKQILCKLGDAFGKTTVSP